MADIDHEIKIQASLEQTFKALSNLNALKAWHTAHIEQKTSSENVLSFQGTEKPTFLWKIIQLEPNKKVIWECLQGPGDAAHTKVIYTLSKAPDNRTVVELSHISWPNQKGNFRKCNTLWGILLHHLKTYLETNKANPAIH